ncbi:hypothetical protein BACCIP111895_04262 [Neobacillus rhizosphaerae]|uniref:Uncharacterized protein n=1 Tax=Neobacillus rhizosphaerae TaxID=2880965 RepID=A0ABN8KXJ7_9BACI|nr:hypothetical protein BACCIP111895_04262 [Neobacillus rhizosphaerae]
MMSKLHTDRSGAGTTIIVPTGGHFGSLFAFFSILQSGQIIEQDPLKETGYLC